MFITVEISKQHLEEISKHLEDSGRLEVGGILLGEHVGENYFRIVAYDVNPKDKLRNGVFIRDEKSSAKKCAEFFKEKNEDFSRFNYLGEWHPQFAVSPSHEDDESMWSILGNSEVGALFAVLMIVKLNAASLECGMWAYFPDRIRESVKAIVV